MNTCCPRVLVIVLLAGCTNTPKPDVAGPTPAAEHPVETLAFDVVEGNIHNYFYRRGSVAAHLLATSGISPRLVVAFPAGNAGVGVWFENLSEPATLEVEGTVEPAQPTAGMRGITAVVRCGATQLAVSGAVLGSIRDIRDYALTRKGPPELTYRVEAGASLILTRTMTDAKHHIALIFEPLSGTQAGVEQGRVVLTAPPHAPILVRATALQDDEPLTPIPASEILREGKASPGRNLDALAFLTYREKLLAGSWRSLTYFGRDTLLATRLLMGVLEPDVVEAALGAVIDRLSPDGDVAHEEDLGDFAARRNLEMVPVPAELQRPIYDYKMIDSALMLAPVLATYLLDTADGFERSPAFLARKNPAGKTYAEAIRLNFNLVLERARPFAAGRDPLKLVALKPGIPVGNWRDSEMGLGHGRYPFDVNAVLVPAALRAIGRLLSSPMFPPTALSGEADKLAKIWDEVAALFRVEIPRKLAVRSVAEYARAQGIESAEPVSSLAGPVVLRALALDAAGRPIPIMHCDDGFALLFGEPSPEYLEEVAGRILRPFPAGLRTPVGLVVANPVFAGAKLRAEFTPGHYHGTVVWSWQQALLAAGLRRQLLRAELPLATAKILREAQDVLWGLIDATATQRTGELWSWKMQDHHFVVVPFGQGRADAGESNAAQLWSTVYLGVRRPAPAAAAK